MQPSHVRFRAFDREYGSLHRGETGIWEAMTKPHTLVDDSDPDTPLSQT
jgi:hypothetical protein